jgi:hypothetical protein
LASKITTSRAESARLTKRRSRTATGKIERFHRTLRRDLLDEVGAIPLDRDSPSRSHGVGPRDAGRSHEEYPAAVLTCEVSERVASEPACGSKQRGSRATKRSSTLITNPARTGTSVHLAAAEAAGVPHFTPSDNSSHYRSIALGTNRNFELRRELAAHLASQAPA